MADEAHHEIVIIKRHRGDHDEHHGGVWKIAFADFMTAMMAFFLVMWLISANDKTRASVARYFNPVRLVDATTQPRGLHDTKKDESGITSSPNTKESDVKDTAKSGGQPKVAVVDKKGETASGREARLDTELRDSPYVALAEIAGVKGPGEVKTETPSSASPPVIGRRGGDSFRDPFAPPPVAERTEADDPEGSPIVGTRKKAALETARGDKAKDAKADREAANREASKRDLKDESEAAARKGEADAAAKAAAETKKTQDEVKGQILASLKTGARDASGPAIDVRGTPEGLLVSLTDTDDFSMFSNGSAVPSKRVVLLMDRVAQVLKGKPGEIVIRGYTDNKPFHSARYDNWHLSLDRAQVTHYMLVRGGLDDARIGHVEGYADRQTKAGLDPASPLNRRIEILLKGKTS